MTPCLYSTIWKSKRTHTHFLNESLWSTVLLRFFKNEDTAPRPRQERGEENFFFFKEKKQHTDIVIYREETFQVDD